MSHIQSFLPILKKCIVQRQTDLFDHWDWRDWRFAYEGGTPFRREYLKKFNDRETKKDFDRRTSLTPIPTYAKKAINGVKNAVSQRLPDIIRRNGSDMWQSAVRGEGRGIDLRGSSMNNYITKKILPELLVMGRVGILVDAPFLDPSIASSATGEITRADVPHTFQPYLNRFVVEASPIAIEAEPEMTSDWAHVLLESHRNRFNFLTGENDCVTEFRYYWLDELRGGLVSIARLNEGGDLQAIVETNLRDIPFVSFDIGTSLMADAAPYQITLLNMLSADSNYAIDANYSFLVRQRGNDNVGSHLRGGKGNDTARSGATKGLYYNKNEQPPAFISPPTEPMGMSLELRREMKKEIDELVTSALGSLSEDGTIEAGIAFIGSCLEIGEERLWDHYTVFEESIEADREVPTIHYPDSWSMITEEQRLDGAEKFLKLATQIVGQKGKKQAAKMAIEKLYRGKIPTKDLDAMKKEIDAAPYATSDPKIIDNAVKNKYTSAETAALAIGMDAGEGTKAMEDAAERAKMVVAAQSDAQNGAAMGRDADDGSVDPNSNEEARQGDTDSDADLKDSQAPGRPEGDDE